MAALTFDAVGEREYQYGIDKAAIYFADGTSAPWNGITSVEEAVGQQQLKSYYLDGQPFLHNVTPGAYEGTISAYTYPEAFQRAEGVKKMDNVLGHPGMAITHQRPDQFNLAYRTKIGNDLAEEAGYKLHMIYNVTALPSSKTFQTLGGDPEATEFSWDIKTIPTQDTGFPTAHVIFDSTKSNWWWMNFIENWLYGTDDPDADPYFPNYLELLYNFVQVNAAGPNEFPVTVVDNFDGTWTATDSNGEITIVTPGEFSIIEVDATYLNAGEYDMETS